MRNFMTGLLVSAAIGVYAQQPSYYLPDFRIFPEEKAVYKWPLRETEYVPDEQVDYTTTELISIAHGITFREYVKDFDLNSFKVLRHNTEPFTDILFVDKNGLYRDFYPDESGYRSMEDLSEKTMLAERVYLDKNNRAIYFIDLIGSELVELENVPSGFDFKTLKPVCDNFFFNKDGLYVFGYAYSESPYYNESSSVNLLKKSNGKPSVPKVYKYYFIYDGEVYARNQCDEVKKLELSPWRIKDLSKIVHPEFLTDGKVTYSGFDKTSSEGFENVANWKTIAENGEFIFIVDEKINRLFMPSDISVPVYDMNLVDFALVWDGEKYLGINSEGNIEHFKSLYIYNYKTKRLEEFNYGKYKRLNHGLYIYDGLLIRGDTPVKGQEALQINKLHPLILDMENASFFTDDKYIYCMDSENTIIKDADIQSLRTINNQLLVDKNRIYSFHDIELTIIPYRSMGLNLKMVE